MCIKGAYRVTSSFKDKQDLASAGSQPGLIYLGFSLNFGTLIFFVFALFFLFVFSIFCFSSFLVLFSFYSLFLLCFFLFLLIFAFFCFCSIFLLSFASLWVYLGRLVLDFGFGSGEVSSLVLCSVRRFLHVVEVFWLILLWLVLVSVWFNLIFGSFSVWTLFSASTSFSTSILLK